MFENGDLVQLSRWDMPTGENVLVFHVGDRVIVECEGVGVITGFDDCSVFVRVDSDGEELLCGYVQLSFERIGK